MNWIARCMSLGFRSITEIQVYRELRRPPFSSCPDAGCSAAFSISAHISALMQPALLGAGPGGSHTSASAGSNRTANCLTLFLRYLLVGALPRIADHGYSPPFSLSAVHPAYYGRDVRRIERYLPYQSVYFTVLKSKSMPHGSALVSRREIYGLWKDVRRSI